MRSPTESPVVKGVLVHVLLAAAGLLVYANSLGGDFVYDDTRQILRNPLIQDPALAWTALTSDVWAFKGDVSVPASNYWRPTFTAWSILNYQLFGTSAWAWHLANVGLHVCVCLLGFRLLRLLGLEEGAAALTTAIYAVHPVHSESIAWVAGAPGPLMTSALLGSLLATARIAQGCSRWFWLPAVALYAVALGAKEVALVCFPLHGLIWAASRRGETCRRTRAWWRVCAPFAALAMIYFVVRWTILGAVVLSVPQSTSTLNAIASVPKVFLFYLRQAFIPIEHGASYSLRPAVGFGDADFWLLFIVALAVSALGVMLARRSAVDRFGLGLFLLPLLPAFAISSLPSDQIVQNRHLYLPVLGLLLILVHSVQRLTKGGERWARCLVFAAAVVVVAAFSVGTIAANRPWSSELALWDHGVSVNPMSGHAWSQYGAALESENRAAEALSAFERSRELRESPRGQLGVARSHLMLGDSAAATMELEDLIRSPVAQESYLLYQAYEALTVALLSDGKPVRAAAELQEARQRLPMYAAALTDKRAVALYQLGEKAIALEELSGAQAQARKELLPESDLVFFHLGMLQAEVGRDGAARQSLTEFLVRSSQDLNEAISQSRRTAEEALKRLED